MTIENYRNDIDAVDREIVRLLNRRASLAKKIGHEKIRNNLSIKNKQREDELLQYLLADNPGPMPDEDLESIYKLIIRTCRELQENYQTDNSN